MVSTRLKNISQIGSFPQVGVKIQNLWNHHLENHRLSIGSNKYHQLRQGSQVQHWKCQLHLWPTSPVVGATWTWTWIDFFQVYHQVQYLRKVFKIANENTKTTPRINSVRNKQLAKQVTRLESDKQPLRCVLYHCWQNYIRWAMLRWLNLLKFIDEMLHVINAFRENSSQGGQKSAAGGGKKWVGWSSFQVAKRACRQRSSSLVQNHMKSRICSTCCM